MKADKFVFLVVYGLGCFSLGGWLNPQVIHESAKVCPEVTGVKPISTSSTKDGEYCFYARTKGQAIYQRRLS